MSRSSFSVLTLLVVFVLASVCYAQPADQRGGGSDGASTSYRGGFRQYQQQVLTRIEEQLTKLRASMDSSSGGRRNWRELSETERNELRERFRKAGEERTSAIAEIEHQLQLLKGRRTLLLEYDDSIGKLYDILELAEKEKGKETVAALEKLIAAENAAFDKKMEALGMQ